MVRLWDTAIVASQRRYTAADGYVGLVVSGLWVMGAVYFGWQAYSALRDGYVKLGGTGMTPPSMRWKCYREKKPGVFWFVFAQHCIISVVCLTIGVFPILHALSHRI
jgi:hypothetical protein